MMIAIGVICCLLISWILREYFEVPVFFEILIVLAFIYFYISFFIEI